MGSYLHRTDYSTHFHAETSSCIHISLVKPDHINTTAIGR